MKVREFLEKKGRNATAVESDRTVEDAIKTMHEQKISAILITEKGKTVGIFTERDVVRSYLSTGGRRFNEVLLREAMAKDIIVAETEDEMCDVMSIMIEKSIRPPPVTQGEKIVGMLSIRDIVKAQVQELHARIHYLKDYVSGIHGGLWI